MNKYALIWTGFNPIPQIEEILFSEDEDMGYSFSEAKKEIIKTLEAEIKYYESLTEERYFSAE